MRDAFVAVDNEGSGILPLTRLPDLLAAFDMRVRMSAPHAEPLSSAVDTLALASSLCGDQRPDQTIILYDELVLAVASRLRGLAASLDAAAADARAAELAGAGALAALAAGGPPPLLPMPALARAPGHSAPAPAAAAPPSVRRFRLWHYNGLIDGGRQPRVVALDVTQADSLLAPVAAHDDTRALLALASAAGVSAGAGHGGGSGGDDDMSAAIAASMMDEEQRVLAESRLMDGSGGSGGGSGGGGGGDVIVVDGGGAAAVSSASASAAGSSAGQLEAILRTKWPGALVVCVGGGPPPSIN